jgi:hypothetical protein
MPGPGRFSAMLMIDEHEGWAVGMGGILHYTDQ